MPCVDELCFARISDWRQAEGDMWCQWLKGLLVVLPKQALQAEARVASAAALATAHEEVAAGQADAADLVSS
jgi:hypothetical protein